MTALQRLPVWVGIWANRPGQPLITGLAHPRPPKIANGSPSYAPWKWRPELSPQKAT